MGLENMLKEASHKETLYFKYAIWFHPYETSRIENLDNVDLMVGQGSSQEDGDQKVQDIFPR